jgi:hypothetical protein
VYQEKKKRTKELPWGKLRPEHRANISAVHVLPQVEERMKAQNSIPLLSFHDSMRKTFTFFYLFRYYRPSKESSAIINHQYEYS